MISDGRFRIVWLLAGLLCLGAGVLGVFLPLLPTTPFLLLAAVCFARGSARLHDWLVTHPKLGPPITQWREHGAISVQAKILAGVALAVTFAISLMLDISGWALAAQAVALAVVALFLFTRPAPPQG